MKKQLGLVVFALMGLLFSTASLANKADCVMDPRHPTPVIHCAYITGLTSSLKDGRYIKMTFLGLGKSAVSCTNNTGTYSILPEDAPQLLNKTTSVQFSICKDKAGSNCQALGTDSFVITQAKSQYIGTPQYYQIDLSAVASKFPQCDATNIPN
ncbi:MAG: hypothetical protein KDH94_08910 [Coxiellaceae bacterium]|nr:hypothetical protein [Coxiellaceae bacterium]